MKTRKDLISKSQIHLRLVAALCLSGIAGMASSRAEEGRANFGDVSFDGPTAQKGVDGTTERLHKVSVELERIQKLLNGVPQPSIQAATAVRDRHQRLLETLADLSAGNPIPDAEASVEDVRNELSIAEEDRDKLNEELLDLQAAAEMKKKGKGLRREVALGDFEAVHLHLVKNRVVPFERPYFSFKTCLLKKVLTGEELPGVSIKRVHDGQAASRAVKPGGILADMMKDKDANKEYFVLRVCADSIQAFHTVAGALSNGGFAYQWDTAKDQEMLIPRERLSKGAEPPREKRGYQPEKN